MAATWACLTFATLASPRMLIPDFPNDLFGLHRIFVRFSTFELYILLENRHYFLVKFYHSLQ